MSTIAILGDCTTTSSLALAVTWPTDRETVLVEADPAGGSIAAWLDEPVDPSLSSIVAGGRVDASPLSWEVIDPVVRTCATGLRHVPAPIRSREAAQAVRQAETTLFPALAAQDERTVLLDLGRLVAADVLPRAAAEARAIVLCHRQDRSSARAAAARLHRLDEMLEVVAPLDVPVVVALIGEEPYDAGEVDVYLRRPAAATAQLARSLEVRPLADDPLAAAVLAGRAGVSIRRLRRLPLMRTASRLGVRLSSLVASPSAETDAEVTR